MSLDEIALTLPADEAFHGVAHLVLSGLVARADLSVETLDDLELGLDALLDRLTDRDDYVTVRVRIGDDNLTTVVGPFRNVDMRAELARHGDDLDLYRILSAVGDRIDVSDADDGQWVELTKRVQRTEPEGGR